jgi:cyanate lyase
VRWRKILAAIPSYRIARRVRSRRATRLVCEGLSDLVGLSDACWIEQIQYNQCECTAGQARLLARVVAIDAAGLHLLPSIDLTGSTSALA